MPRGRKPAARRTRILTMALDEELLTKVELLLWSDAEKKIPYGAHQRLFTNLLQQMFETRKMDLSPYAGSLPGAFQVRGTPATLDVLRSLLENKGSGG